MPKNRVEIKVDANLKALKQNMKQGTRVVAGSARKMASTVNHLRKSFLGLKAGIAVAAGVAGMGLMIRQSLKVNDEMAKISANIGVATGALTAFHLSGQLAGVTIETVNSSLKRMVKRLGEAAQGTGAAKKQLEEWGLDANKMAQMKPEDAFQGIADAIREMDTQTGKVAATAAIFGREGIDMVAMLEGGSAAFRAAARDTQLFGTAISRVDAKKIEDFNDEMTRGHEIMKGFATRVTLKFADTMKPIIENLNESARETEGFKNEVDDLAGSFANMVSKGVSGTSNVLKVIKEMRAFFKEHQVLARIAEIAAPGLSLPITPSVKKTTTPGTSGSFFPISPFAMRGGQLPPMHGKTEMKGFAMPTLGHSPFADLEAEITRDLAVITKEMQSSADSWEEIVKTPFEVMQEQFFEIQELSKAGIINDDVFKRSMDKISTDFLATKETMETEWTAFSQERNRLDMGAKDFAILQFKEEFDQYKIFVDQGRISSEEFTRLKKAGIKQVSDTFKADMTFMEELTRQTARNMHGAFDDFYFRLMKRDFEDFGDWMEGFFDSLLRSVSSKLSEFTVGGLEDLLGAIFKGGGTGGGGTGGGGILAGIKGIFGFADGGLITRPTLALMGEAGPEVVAPESDFKDFVASLRGGTGGSGILAGTKGIFGFADGGLITRPTLALMGEAGPEIVAPESDFNDFVATLQGGKGGGDLIVKVIMNNPIDMSVMRRSDDEIVTVVAEGYAHGKVIRDVIRNDTG